jgi:RNA polymerase sigma-70 factor (ECF subfamily)
MTASKYFSNSDPFDQTSLVALIPQMRGFARSLCRSRGEAEDITQDALANAWASRRTFEAGTNLKAWVFRILRNRFYTETGRAWRTTQLDPQMAEETLVTVSDPDAALELDDVRRAMLELSDERREALTLVAAAGLTYDEAAVVCGCALGTIRSRISRARQALAAILAGTNLPGQSGVPGGAMAFMTAEAGRLQARAAA